MNKKIFSLGIALCIMLSTTIVSYGAVDRGVELSPNAEPIQVMAGGKFASYQVELEISKDVIENAAMDELEITVSQSTSSLSPIELKNIKYSVKKTADELEILSDNDLGTAKILTFSIDAKAGEKVAAGLYTLPMNISYKYTGTVDRVSNYNENIYFRVVRQDIDFEPEVTSLVFRSFRINEQPKDRDLEAGDRFIVLATMENRGDTYLEDVKVSLTNLSPDLFTPVAESSTKFLDLDPGDRISAAYELRISDDVKAGKYLLTCRADYRTPEGVLKFEETQMFVTVGGEPSRPDSDFSTPVVMVKNYYFGKDHVTGGETFNLTMNFLNTNKESDVDNLKITVSDPTDTIMPKSGSNTIYIEKIPKEQMSTNTITMRSNVDADPKSYQLNITYQFETVINERRIKVTDTEEISIPLKQKEVLTVDQVVMPDTAVINKEIPLAATFVNKGRTDLTNLTVSINADFTYEEQPYYVGTLSAGRSDSYDAILKIDKAGVYTGEILFVYDNQDGEETKYSHPFSINIVESEEQVKTSVKPVFAPRTDLVKKKTGILDMFSNINPTILITIILVVVALVAGVIIRKNTKGKK